MLGERLAWPQSHSANKPPHGSHFILRIERETDFVTLLVHLAIAPLWVAAPYVASTLKPAEELRRRAGP
jgi:hypothetical protein